FALVIEPSRTDGGIHLARIPSENRVVGAASHQRIAASKVVAVDVVSEARERLVGDFPRLVITEHWDHAPLAGARMPGFVAAPADIGPADGDGCVWHKLANQLPVSAPVIYLLFSVGAFTAGAVKPDLFDAWIVCQNFPELVQEVLVIPGRIAIGFLMSIPGRDVDYVMHPFGAAGLDKLPHDVAMSVFPGAVPDAMLGVLGGSEAEAIVMLGGKDHSRDTSGFGRCH